MAKKLCTRCKKTKPQDQFYKRVASADGLCYQCKSCHRERNKANRDELLAYQKHYYQEHREETLNRQREYMKNKDNQERKKITQKAWVQENRAKVNAKSAKWIKKHPERFKEVLERSREKNRERRNTEYNYRMKHDLDFKIPHLLRSRIRMAVKKEYKAGSAVRDLGCSIEKFKEYIANQFQPGMTWDNWGEWHLDHIQPLNSFDLTNRSQILKACHFSNMQPLWANDNLIKGCKI